MPTDLTPPRATTAKKIGCSTCGSVPSPEARPELKRMFGLKPQFSLPCSVPGCSGEVVLSDAEYRALEGAGMVAKIGTDAGSVGLALERAREVMYHPSATLDTQLAAAKLLLRGSNERLDRAGMGSPSKNSPSVVVNVNTVEPGDNLDQELEEMFDEKRRGEVIDVEPVAGTPLDGGGSHKPAHAGSIPAPATRVPEYADPLKDVLGLV